MSTSRKMLYAALFSGVASQAYGVDLSSYPTELLGPLANANAAIIKGPAACDLGGMFYLNGTPVNFAGHVKLIHDGIQDGSGFGHFLSPAGRESFVSYSVPYTIPNGDGSFTDGGFTCLQHLDLASSKYAANKYGVGISELHWFADSRNPQVCQAFIDQLGWLIDKNGHAVATRINEEMTTTKAALKGDCYKSN